MNEDLADEGIMVKGKEKVLSEHIAHGIQIATENAKLDIGQSVVVSNGTVLAVEAFEGTNAMLERAGSFNAKKCIFVKVNKPNQDTRFDIPVFGTQTLNTMKRAGIGTAILKSNSVLILEKISFKFCKKIRCWDYWVLNKFRTKSNNWLVNKITIGIPYSPYIICLVL